MSATNSSPLRRDPAVEQPPAAESSGGASVVPGEGPLWDSETGKRKAPLTERQDRAAAALLSQIADLIANVRHGIVRNDHVQEPAKANFRLLSSATGLVSDLADATRVAGKRLFDLPHRDGNTPIDIYARSSSAISNRPSDFVSAAQAMVKAVENEFKSLTAGSIDDAGRTSSLLSGLENRVRSLKPGPVTLREGQKLDRLL